jgi:PAS domain S-box-containing protein
MQRDGQVDDLEVRMRGVDGRCFWALVSASMVEFENEPAIFAAINDITARKRMEVALREQEEFFRLIAENMGDMVAVLDLDGRRLYNSPSYGALFGDITALKGTDSFAEIHPDDRARVRQVFRETIATGCGQRATFRFVLPDGGVREMESQGGVIRGPDGQVERVVVVSRDITERRRMEDEIRQLNADLEARVRARTSELAAANKELETFTYSVSHDLKAPLRGIDGYSRLLLEGHLDRLDEEGRMFLGNVRRGVDQMSQLIEDLLAYSRMERRDLHGMSLDLARQVDMALAERREDIQVSGMLVRVDVEPLVVQADPDGLAMVLRNLIDNALKFSRDSRPPTLTISATPGEGNVILTIRDNGIGFDMRFQERIFEIFQRLQRAEDYPGTGVGLAIVRKAMQRMGGQVRVESSPGQGAAFHLELPR